MVFNNYYYY